MEFTKERVELRTEDNISLVGNYYPAGGNGILLLHQLDLDRNSWDRFAKLLQQRNLSVLALDFRGHGESQGKWQSFSEKDFRAMLLDAKAGAAFLHAKGKNVSAILGASIGANTAFRYSAEHRVPAVLLSPGLDYRGIDINTVTSTAPTLILVGVRDAYSHTSSVELDANNLHGSHELVVLDTDKHGTFLLDEPGMRDRIFAFLDAQG